MRHLETNVEKSIIFRKQRQVINEAVDSKLFSCYICNYSAFSKHHLIDHMIVHDNEKYGPDYSKGSGWNANISQKRHKPIRLRCVHCDATFKSKLSLADHVVRKHPDFISSVTHKLYECTKCTFKTVQKICFDKHLLKHPELSSDFKHITCVHCNATFKSKTALDYHVVGKHPDFISSITSKLHECTKCTFKTVKKCFLDKHLLRHSGHASNFKHKTCVHCNATFKSKMALDDHVVRKHPDFISSVTHKLHECTKCTYKTVKKAALDYHVVGKHPDFISSITSKLYECTKCSYKTVKKCFLDKHLLKHPGLVSNFKHKTCVHCNAKFRSKLSLDDHIVRKHPDFMSSITSKLHECTICTFKTVRKCSFGRHLLKHPELASDFKHIACVHCNATFKSKTSLDDHVVRKHPDFISSITSKLHECTKCPFKAVKKYFFDKHLLKHSGLASNFKQRTCVHCNVTFKSKIALDDHVLRKHPDFISSVTSKLHECTQCTFKTVRKDYFDMHLLKHPGLASDFKHITACIVTRHS
nr:unnamed protein product [Callosobruchus analis]